jgi:hypothetical protein
MATITMPPKSKKEEASTETSQKRPSLERYRLQVDRQTKDSFGSFEAAEKAAKAIKKAYRGVRKAVGIGRGAISGSMKVSFQAARSIG